MDYGGRSAFICLPDCDNFGSSGSLTENELESLEDTMQTVQEFMNELFRQRTAEIGNELKRKAVSRRKFYSDACLWDSRSDAVERSESERIENIWESDSESRVITRDNPPFPRLCYHLKLTGERWLIQSVSLECVRCGGNPGNTSCLSCQGRGWLHQDDVLGAIKRMEADDRH